jgi:hypothetical protein
MTLQIEQRPEPLCFEAALPTVPLVKGAVFNALRAEVSALVGTTSSIGLVIMLALGILLKNLPVLRN